MSVTITGGDLCSASLKLIGVLSEGETASSELMQDALSRLNEMIDGLGTQRLSKVVQTRAVFSTVANQGTYNIGPSGADWTAPRPVAIEGAGLILTSSTPNVEIRLTPLTDDQYRLIGIKDLSSGLPTCFYYNTSITSDKGTFVLWPIPMTAANSIALYVWRAIGQFTTLTTSIVLAPMYAKALRYGLAKELAIELGRPLTPMLQKVFDIADQSWTDIKAVNLHLSDLSIDPALAPLSPSVSTYNILSDSNS